MDLPKITSPGTYRFAQKGGQRIHAPWISLYISGLVHNSVYYPDGKLCATYERKKDGTATPCLGLGYPGFYTDFEYDSSRENYVIVLNYSGLRYDEKQYQLYLDYNGTLLPVPRTIELDPSEVAPLREQFKHIAELFYSTIPCNQLTAESMVQTLLTRFLQTPQPIDDVVEALRKRIDNDGKWEKSIEQHCRELGENRDSLRYRFMERYKIAPGEYRMRKRLQKIIQFLTYSQMSFKEIAFEVGMRNATHLNSLLRKYYGDTPSNLRKIYRQGGHEISPAETRRK